MNTVQNIYATCVSLNGKAVLLTGESGSGKSDLALRLIMNKGALLIADDRTDVWEEGGVLWAAAPQNIKSMLEVRGIGICRFESLEKAPVALVVELVKDFSLVERLPQSQKAAINGVVLPVVKICPFEVSAADKVVLACK